MGHSKGGPTNLFGWVPKAQEGLPSSFNVDQMLKTPSDFCYFIAYEILKCLRMENLLVANATQPFRPGHPVF